MEKFAENLNLGNCVLLPWKSKQNRKSPQVQLVSSSMYLYVEKL